MTRLNHLPFLMTFFKSCSSAAAKPKPITKMKMNLMSLQMSVKKPKNQRFPSGNQFLKAASTIPIHKLGTEIKNNFFTRTIGGCKILYFECRKSFKIAKTQAPSHQLKDGLTD